MTLIQVGSKCALLLPKHFIYPHKTPAKGLVTNILLDSSALVLVEEVWRLDKNLDVALTGWLEAPKVIGHNYLMLPINCNNLLIPSNEVLSLLINFSIKDYLSSEN